MKKVGLAAVGILAMTGGSVVAQATTEFPESGKAESSVRVLIENDGDIEIPNPEPEKPDPEPENPNPEPGLLDVLYVSPLDFGTVVLNGEEQVIDAKEDVGSTGQIFSPMVSVQDRRADAHRQGWALTVRYEADFLDGAEIKMNPYVHSSNQEEFGIETGGEISLSTNATTFAEAGQVPYARHTVSMGMAQPDQAVQLVIPGEDYASGEYTTTIVWELTDGPLG
ncbi:WxL domain-containing protein [Enterococcus thailandicus]|uniref:WxL domain-containing protein n=1 Tax=Enterococcus thailandicus TaxID=417368 RepID=UPI00288FDCCF|nr:WxL domain-containing protein [Enterococcus thailandicus]MDT2751773.1 WxL domain-containing protein [Enterococcus thailandicus]MDT2775914.1 WxL domain-containing protein [Enterococcus thailandicus]MDT2795173.1 WxL domain-containing protein [Enterococcus thailandicus]